MQKYTLLRNRKIFTAQLKVKEKAGSDLVAKPSSHFRTSALHPLVSKRHPKRKTGGDNKVIL